MTSAETLTTLIVSNEIDYEKLRPKILSSCVDGCPFGIRHILHLINFVIGIILLLIMIILTLLICLFALIWRYFCCQLCCCSIETRDSKRYYPAKPNCCCNVHSRNFYTRWRIWLITTPYNHRWCCYFIQDRIVLFYQMIEFVLNLGNGTIVDLFHSLGNHYGEYFPFNQGIVTCNSQEIVELTTSEKIDKPRSVFALEPSTENHAYTRNLLPIQDTNSKDQISGRNIFHDLLASFYHESIYDNGKTQEKNWKDIFDNIRKQGEYLIPRAGGGLIIPEKKKM